LGGEEVKIHRQITITEKARYERAGASSR